MIYYCFYYKRYRDCFGGVKMGGYECFCPMCEEESEGWNA